LGQRSNLQLTERNGVHSFLQQIFIGKEPKMHNFVNTNSLANVTAPTQRVAGYLRVATVKQAQHDLAISLQEEKIRAYCAANNLELIQVFKDMACSSRNPKGHGLQALIDYALSSENGIHAVIVSDYSRITRSAPHLQCLVERLNDAGKVLLSTQCPRS
jgi:hypothetical protein